METFKLINHIESCEVNFSSNDAATEIARYNAFSGMKAIFSCMESNGILGSESKFIELPDFTYSKNAERWNSGFSNGCIMYLDTKDTPFIPIGFRPNSCGVTFAKIEGWNGDGNNFLKQFKEIIDENSDINSDDFGRKNHFVGIYKKNDEFYIILHGSFSKIKSGVNGIPGLYYDKEHYWDNKLKKYTNENLELVYLIGEEAVEYYQNYKKYENLSTKLRKQIIDNLFPNNELIFEGTHQGFYDINTILLGGYFSKNPITCPIMVSPDMPLYEVETPKSVISIKNQNYYCLPHGAGYKLATDCMAQLTDIPNIFSLQYENEAKVFTRYIELFPFEYRKDIIDVCCTRHKLGCVSNRFEPILNIKI